MSLNKVLVYAEYQVSIPFTQIDWVPINVEIKNSNPRVGGVFGHGEWGMGHGEEVTNAQCPMPQATGQLSLSTHSWDGVSRRFQ